jgi:phosphatidylglycerol:prolipoprotein diacylglycerol transferase
MICWIYWDPDPTIFTLPFLNWPILWYGFFFSLGFLIGFPIFVHLVTRYFVATTEKNRVDIKNLRGQAILLADRLTVYLVVGTIVGARLGHFLFYETPSDYLRDPLEIFRIWRGGLASHGALIAIIFSIFLFSRKIRSKFPSLDWIRILDFLAVPAAWAGCCIRVGNFFNQEILGTLTQVPWAVIFGHSFDQTSPAPRHPVQLYEAFGYLLVFFLLGILSYSRYFLIGRGKLIGLFLILVFTFRFFMEFLKTEQSRLFSSEHFLTMGQILSVPVILLGIIFYFFSSQKNR